MFIAALNARELVKVKNCSYLVVPKRPGWVAWAKYYGEGFSLLFEVAGRARRVLHRLNLVAAGNGKHDLPVR